MAKVQYIYIIYIYIILVGFYFNKHQDIGIENLRVENKNEQLMKN